METSYIQYPGQYENVLKGFEALLSSSKNIALYGFLPSAFFIFSNIIYSIF